MENNEYYWQKAIDFHGHKCGGLAIGVQASMYAMKLLEADRAEDEEIVCISENDACGVDAVQAILGCTAGKGNLIIKMRGKQAFSFFNRKNGKSCRLVLRRTPEKTREERLSWLYESDCSEIFDVKPVKCSVPEKASIFKTYVCTICGEGAAESCIRLINGQQVCLDCFEEYAKKDM